MQPETPRSHNDDSLEKSLRRQQASTRSINDIARSLESPISNQQGDRSITLPPISSSLNQVDKNEFQEWMKLVRTKRVKTTNAFTIQLIDAFYSMVQGHVLSNDETRYSFQEATHTLGGCLTVYKNRIARVKNDTSRLLVGVTENHQDDMNEDEEGDLDEEGGNKTKERKRRRNDDFLVSEEKLKIDPNDLKSAIDPLLRKMSADFDKSGANALLQYSLKTDLTGRLLLDADTQAGEDFEGPNQLNTIAEEDEEEEEELNEEGSGSSPSELALSHYHLTYLSSIDINQLESLPLVDSIQRAVVNPKETAQLLNELEIWSSANPAEEDIEDEYVGEDVESNIPLEGLGLNINNDFDDPNNDEDELTTGFANLSIASVVSNMPLDGNWQNVDYLRNLDQNQMNWAGPSYWKVQKLNKPDEKSGKSSVPAAKKDKLPPVLIDFNESVDIDDMFKSSSRSINLASNTLAQTTLPTDMHFTTKGLTSLYQLPDDGVAPAFKRGPWSGFGPDDDEEQNHTGDYDDMPADDVSTNYYNSTEDPKVQTASDFFHQNQTGTLLKTNQLNFARVAKRVDVRKLKQNVWNAIENHEANVGLLDIIRETQPLYNDTQRSELSPAMYFVSLLHLSNEKGLRLQNTATLRDVQVVHEQESTV